MDRDQATVERPQNHVTLDTTQQSGRAVLGTSSVAAALFGTDALVAAILVLIGLVLLYKGIHVQYRADLRQA